MNDWNYKKKQNNEYVRGSVKMRRLGKKESRYGGFGVRENMRRF